MRSDNAGSRSGRSAWVVIEFVKSGRDDQVGVVATHFLYFRRLEDAGSQGSMTDLRGKWQNKT